ncbi:MAG: serine hydrolase [Alphaproteobacteria bacterium]|nr:serine hydrolase [Alphaproteobacteria bacterium]
MRLPSLLVAMSVLAALSGLAFADEAKTPAPRSIAELDQRIGKSFQDSHIPDASVVLIEDGKVVVSKGYGLADVAAKVPVTTDTVFRAGSISKSIVGIAVMMLVEEGKIDLNAKLADVAPEIKFVNPWEATDPVRVVNLLEHTTGFDDIGFHHYLLAGDVPLLQAVQLYGPYRSRWKPGTYASYSNAPPVMAGYLVEKASGMSWAEFTRTRIFEPLGMTSAHWTLTPDIAGRISKSYSGTDASFEEPYVDIVGKPAGSLDITPIDLAKLALFLINRGSVNGRQLLKPESVAQIETTTTTIAARNGLTAGYGLGNYATATKKAVYRGHNGGIDGFAASYIYNAEHKAGAVMMINSGQSGAQKAMDEITAYLERDWPKPAVVEVKPEPGELEALAGYYQSITPRQAILAPLEHILSWTPVEVKNGALWINGTQRHEVGRRLFEKPDVAGPNVVFADGPEGPQLLTMLEADRRVPMYEMAVKGVGAALYVALLAFSLLYAVAWIVGLLRGRLAERGGVLVRLLPTLALVAPAALLGLLVMVLSDNTSGSITTLGTPSIMAQSLMYLSYSIPVLGGLALLSALIATNAPRWVRGFAILSAVLAFGVTAFLWPYGWIGLQTWV